MWGLKELAWPEAIPFVPQTIGWLVVALVVLALLAWLAWRARRRWQNNAYRREALASIEAMFDMMTVEMHTAQGRQGCMAINGGTELGHDTEFVIENSRRFREGLREVLRSAVTEAADRGELAPGDTAWSSDLETLHRISEGGTAPCPLGTVVAKYLINEHE